MSEQQSNKVTGMKNGRTFKKLYLKSDAIEYLARQNKENKRVRKLARKLAKDLLELSC